MLEQAKIKLRELIFKEDGVAMAWTLIVFLCFFMLCMSVYALAENVNRRIVLQNACDNAAYSAAVVQADMLSRIAVLNRALSWTYAETNKRQMDFIVDRWLQDAVKRYNEERDAAIDANAGACSHGGSSPPESTPPSNGAKCSYCTEVYAWIAGCRINGDWYAESINLNGRIEPVATIESNTGNADDMESTNISNGITNIEIINNSIKNIRSNLNSYIGRAVTDVMGKYFDDSSDFLYITDGSVNNTGEATYLTPETSEDNLFAYTRLTAAGVLQNGLDIWWKRSEQPASNGIYRFYSQADNALVATINALSYSHNDADEKCSFVMTYDKTAGVKVYGSGVTNAVARPYRLTPGYFGSAGTIVVAAKQRMTNPFDVLFTLPSDKGAYGMFDISSTDMWAVSAARAGVKLGSDSTFYTVQWPGATFDHSDYLNGVWNLCEEDWDAVILPVNRAWNDTNAGSWTGDADPVPLLEQVRNSLNVQTLWRPGSGTDRYEQYEHMKH